MIERIRKAASGRILAAGTAGADLATGERENAAQVFSSSTIPLVARAAQIYWNIAGIDPALARLAVWASCVVAGAAGEMAVQGNARLSISFSATGGVAIKTSNTIRVASTLEYEDHKPLYASYLSDLADPDVVNPMSVSMQLLSLDDVVLSVSAISIQWTVYEAARVA